MVKIKRLRVIKVASFLGLYAFFVGLILGIIALLVFSLILNPFLSYDSSVFGIGNVMSTFSISSLNGWLSILVIAFGFGVVNFILGLIFTPIANLTLSIIKGIDIKIDMENGHLEIPKENLEYLPSNQRESLY